MMIRAVELGHNINGELAGAIPGVLRDYFEDLKLEAIDACAGLVVAHPTDVTTIMNLQRKTAAYAHLDAWLKTKLGAGRAAEAEWEAIKDQPGLEEQ
jgi:hypothetical protein